MLKKEDLIGELNKLGIAPGDKLYIRSRVSSIGRIAAPGAETLLAAILELIGSDGLLVVPAFTAMDWVWKRSVTIFDENTATNSGALSKAVLNHTERVRSRHPSHSIAAIGRGAESIVQTHLPSAAPFSFMRHLVGLNAKMLLIGCNTESPGFSTVHYAQETLGLTQRHWTKFLFHASIIQDEKRVNWKPDSDPGCSRGFGKMYPHYADNSNFQLGKIGNAEAIIVRAKAAFEMEMIILKEDPLAVLCDNSSCVSCRILRAYNFKAAPKALLSRMKNAFRSRAGTSHSNTETG
jgi:aminoglycoside 3-N-acetyltransferase